MTWQNEMTVIVRHLVHDVNSNDYTFIDSRLEEAILVSAQLSMLEIDFENTYAIDVDSLTLTPDPTSSSDKDDSFINLVSLKTAQMLIGSELKTHSLNAISLRDGPSALDLRGIITGLKILFDDINKKYEEAVMQFKMNGVVGQAILGPYSPGSDIVGRSNYSNRSGRF